MVVHDQPCASVHLPGLQVLSWVQRNVRSCARSRSIDGPGVGWITHGPRDCAFPTATRRLDAGAGCLVASAAVVPHLRLGLFLVLTNLVGRLRERDSILPEDSRDERRCRRSAI